MTDVFISYAREDQARAAQIAHGLEAMGLSTFWDTAIPPGQTWADYIEGKLSQCKAVIVLWSAHSTQSQWVREEARMGRDRGRLIPAMLDGSSPPFGFGEVQAANLATWRGEPNHPEWQRFSQAIYGAVHGAGATPPPQAATAQPRAQSAWSAPHAEQGGAGGAETLSPIGYIQKCFRLYVNGNGRARRAEYGWFVLAWVVFAFGALVVDIMLTGFNAYTSSPNVYLLTWLSLGFIAPGVSVASRRFHDLGQNGWLAALTLIPYIGWIVILVLVFAPGQAGTNQYGANPKGV